MPRPASRIASRPALLGLSAIIVAASAAAMAWAMPDRAPAKRPQRIVSLNLCADQYLLELADRDQIAGLTRNAADPDMSAAAARAAGLNIMGTSAEELLVLDPDLIIGIPAKRGGMMAAVAQRDYTVLDLKSAASYPDIVAQIREVAAAVGHVARGEALIARMDRDLAALPKSANAGVAAYYQRRGYMTGTGTLIDDVMTRTGLTNLAARLDKPALSQLSLEEMVAARPDYLIVESATDRVTDQGTEMLHHPALNDIPRLSIPQAWTVCGSPAYVRAARSLADQIAAHRQVPAQID
jgi:iron complex transport system substrate-binding protein